VRTTIRRPVYAPLKVELDYGAIEHFEADSPEIEQEGQSLLNEMDSLRYRMAEFTRKLIEGRIATVSQDRNELVEQAQEIDEQALKHQEAYAPIAAALNALADAAGAVNVSLAALRRDPPRRSACTDFQWSEYENSLAGAGAELDKAQARLREAQGRDAAWQSHRLKLKQEHDALIQRIELLDDERDVLQGKADPQKVITDPNTGMPMNGTGFGGYIRTGQWQHTKTFGVPRSA
jgi:hypothetical protein